MSMNVDTFPFVQSSDLHATNKIQLGPSCHVARWSERRVIHYAVIFLGGRGGGNDAAMLALRGHRFAQRGHKL